MRLIEEVEGVRRIKESTVRMVELVGSDKLLSGGNRGLLSLDLVVSALGNPQRNAMDKVSFRDSPVTRILRDSIAGTAMSVVLCCVSPLATDIQETNRSLEFGRRANKISNDPKPRITLIPLSTNDMDDDDEDISRVRSASVNRGNLPPLSPPSDDVDGSYINNNNDAESSISISAFSQHVELQQEQQAQLLAQHLHQIAPPPPPGVDPILYNLHLIQYSGLLNVAIPTVSAPVAQPAQMGNGIDNREVYYNSHLASQQDQNQMSPQRSSPTLSPLSQRSPLSANVYWQSTPVVQIQRNQQQLPPPQPPISIPPPPPLLDPATAPINLDEIERKRSDEGSTVRKSEGDACAKNWRTPKMPSILEVSENGSVTNSSTSTTTGANANATAKSLEGRQEEVNDHDEDGDTTSEAEVDSEEFDSECSDFSGVEGIDTEVVDTSAQVMGLMSQFVTETEDVVRESELEWQVKWTTSKSIGERLAALHIQPENHLPSASARPEEGDAMLKELRKAQDAIKTLESREGQLIERLSVISSREEMLVKEAEHAERLKASLEEHIKENEVTAFSTVTMKKDCERLRRYKSRRFKEREELEMNLQKLKLLLYQKPEDEGVVADFSLVGAKIAELDELFYTVDLAIEFKNEKLTGKALDYLRNNSSGGDPDLEDNDLTQVLKRLSTEECRALIHRLQLRVITLSSGLVDKEVENLQLNYRFEETIRYFTFLLLLFHIYNCVFHI